MRALILAMKQQCYLAAIYLNWLLLAGGVGYLLFTHRFAFAIAWVIALPLVMWGYVRAFPSISPAMGYGGVEDKPAHHADVPGSKRQSTAVTVRVYTALGCPFCPIVEKRVHGLRETMNFKVETIDVTLRPDLLASKGIRAVPVIEVGDSRIEGNATSEQIADLILSERAFVG